MGKFVLFVIAVVVLVFLFSRMGGQSPIQANALAIDVSYGIRTGGDCHAQLASGDTYDSVVDESCMVVSGDGRADALASYKKEYIDTPVPTANDRPSRPSIVVTSAPTKETDVPAPTEVVVTDVPTQAPTEAPTQVVVPTEAPTQEPTQDPTSAPCDDKVKHPNKGEGNGGEDADPGNNPDKGNDDENEGGKDKGKH